ncbi:MAG: hypothetical protein ACYC92_12840 [Candidatus Acidiferrales bacterium]
MFQTVFSTILALAFLLGTGVYGASKPPDWPLIKPLSWSGDIDLLGPPTLISIQSTKGTIVYRLYCSSWLAPPEPEWLTQGDSYGGDFECLLTDGKPGTPAKRATLLNYDPEDTSPYHFNEGSFVWKEILGKCWNNPEWGADRTFYLRGMRLRIHVVAVRVVESYQDKVAGKIHPIIRQVTVKITAEPDKNANTELARPPTQPEPKGCMASGMW